MKTNFMIVALLGSIVFSSGCKQTTSISNDSIEDVFPLKVGDSWTYHLQNWTDSVTKVVDTTINILIQSQLNVQGHTTYFYTLGDTNHKNSMYYSGTDLFMGSDSNSSSLSLRYPMSPDEAIVTFDTTNSDGIRQTSKLIFRQSNEPISVPAGQFSCYHYEELRMITFQNKTDTVFLSKLYYAKNVGLVLEEDFLNYTGNRYMSLLEQLLTYVVE